LVISALRIKDRRIYSMLNRKMKLFKSIQVTHIVYINFFIQSIQVFEDTKNSLLRYDEVGLIIFKIPKNKVSHSASKLLNHYLEQFKFNGSIFNVKAPDCIIPEQGLDAKRAGIGRPFSSFLLLVRE
jgi:hypothetical protein